MITATRITTRCLTLGEAREAAYGQHACYPDTSLHNGYHLKWVLKNSAATHRYIQIGECKKCVSRMFGVWLEQRYVNGDRIAVLRCLICGNQAKSVGVNKFGLIELPMWSDDRSHAACARCGSRGGTEEHHWAPRHLFGPDADNWPTSRLCRKCHALWHRKVTPTMSQLGKTA